MKRVMGGALVALLAIVAGGSAAWAQSGGGSNAIQFRLGGFFPEGNSDFWDDTEARFTISAGDFDGVAAGFTYVHGFSNWVELGVNVDFFDETVLSAERDFVDEDGFSILHDTQLSTIPVVVDLRFVPFGRYKQRGPRQVLKPVFYIGGGIGANFYEYEEVGDFVDDLDPDDPFIFPAGLRSRDIALVAHALAGLEFPVSGPFNILVEGRYLWSEADLDDDFSGFGEIDLGGPAAFVGGSFRW